MVASAGQHVLDEAERSLHDALCVLSQTVRDSRVLYGGGWAETQVGCGVAISELDGGRLAHLVFMCLDDICGCG